MKGSTLNRHVFLVIITIFILNGCSSKPREDFNLIIVLSDRLGENATEKLPQDIIDLALPIEHCENFNLIPNVTLQRLDDDKASSMSLNIKIKAGMSGDSNNPRFIRRKIEKYLATKEIGSAFSKPVSQNKNMTHLLETYLAKIGNKSIGIFFKNSNETEEIYKNIKYSTTINDVQNYIATKLCDKRGSSVYVFLNPPGTNEAHQGSDKTLKHLAKINHDASKLKNKHQRINALNVVRERIKKSNDPSDYRYTYELMKNRIYGKNHHEAFELLQDAAVIAIKHGQADYLLDRIMDDRNTTLVKLSRGHNNDWKSIIEGLKHKDKNRIHLHKDE